MARQSGRSPCIPATPPDSSLYRTASRQCEAQEEHGENVGEEFIYVLPHPDFEKRWDAEWQERYNAIRQQADDEVTICKAACRSAYQRRNEWMVNHSARVIAVYNGTRGSTRNTIKYAMKRGVEVYYAKGWDGVCR